MKSERKKQIMTLSILVVAVLVISVGFAVFSTTLRIRSSATVNPNANTFMVKFSTTKDTLTESAVVPSNKTTGITATNGTIDNTTNPTISNLSAEFTTPGDYVEYTFYARNEGEFLAYLTNINYVGETSCVAGSETTDSYVQEACKAMNVKVTVGGTTYNNTSTVTGHTLAKNTGEEVKVRIEYGSNGAVADGPFTVTFGEITMTYASQDGYVVETPTVTQVYKPQYYGDWDLSGTIGTTVAPSNPLLVPPTGKNFYLGYDVENDIVSAAYACFVRNETEYCLKGTTDGSAYETNKTVLEDAFKDVENVCSFDAGGSFCDADGLFASADSSDYVTASGDDVVCSVSGAGTFGCSGL